MDALEQVAVRDVKLAIEEFNLALPGAWESQEDLVEQVIREADDNTVELLH
jgi:hypothetical protein